MNQYTGGGQNISYAASMRVWLTTTTIKQIFDYDYLQMDIREKLYWAKSGATVHEWKGYHESLFSDEGHSLREYARIYDYSFYKRFRFWL